MYEKQQIDVQNYPFAMNKELYELIQTGNPYSTTNGQLYKGQSGKNLFDIQYVERDNFSVTGPWYKVTLQDRIGIGVGTPNKVGEFMADYFKTIRVVDTTNIMANIMEALSGAASIKANAGIGQIGDQTKFGAIVQRILGLCFDNRKEIQTSDGRIFVSAFEAASALGVSSQRIRQATKKNQMVGNVQLKYKV